MEAKGGESQQPFPGADSVIECAHTSNIDWLTGKVSAAVCFTTSRPALLYIVEVIRVLQHENVGNQKPLRAPALARHLAS